MSTTKPLLLSLMLATAVVGTPAIANWFSNPSANVNLNVGSAPSPTPQQLRAIGDSDLAPRSYRGASIDMTGLEGKMVFGRNGARLGYVLAVDNNSQMVELQTRGGVGVAMPADLLVDRGRSIEAPTVSRADVIDMARAQTGRTVAIESFG